MRYKFFSSGMLAGCLLSFTQVHFTSAQPVLSPSAPVLGRPAPSFVPGAPVAGPAIAVAATNSPAGNISVEEISLAILNLQAALEQSLPAVSSFNTNIQFAPVPGVLISDAPTANFSQNLGRNLGVNAGVNFGRNLAVNSAVNAGVPVPQRAPTMPALPATPAVPVPATDMPLLTQETVRSLLLLQQDMERMLPVLAALNGTTNATAIVLEDATAAGTAGEESD